MWILSKEHLIRLITFREMLLSLTSLWTTTQTTKRYILQETYNANTLKCHLTWRLNKRIQDIIIYQLNLVKSNWILYEWEEGQEKTKLQGHQLTRAELQSLEVNVVNSLQFCCCRILILWLTYYMYMYALNQQIHSYVLRGKDIESSLARDMLCS